MFEVIKSTLVKHRSEFPAMCNELGIHVAIELGTDIGAYAAEFMANFNGELICIDSYKSYEEWMPNNRLADIIMAANALAPYHPRARIIIDDSVAVADRLPLWITHRLGFVYVDATHEYDPVTHELNTWWPLIKNGGVLAGHDYSTEHHSEVVRAVNDFAKRHDRTVYTVTGDYIPSWYILKD